MTVFLLIVSLLNPYMNKKKYRKVTYYFFFHILYKIELINQVLLLLLLLTKGYMERDSGLGTSLNLTPNIPSYFEHVDQESYLCIIKLLSI